MSELDLHVLPTLRFYEKISGVKKKVFNDKITIWGDYNLDDEKGKGPNISIMIDRWKGKLDESRDPDETMSATLIIPEVIVLKKYLETFLELCSLD